MMKKNMFRSIVGCTLAFLLVLGGCSSKGGIKSGTYTASAQGMNGDVKVEVIMGNEKIESIKVIEHKETPGISDTPIQNIPSDIVEYQSVNVDVITGATLTSNAILAAVKDCLKQAGADETQFMAETNNVAGELVSKEADVVIIGGGGAGMSAAVAAAENGAKVIVIEKTAALGGNTVLAGGGYNAFDAQREQKQEMTAAQRATIDKIVNTEAKNDVHQQLIDQVKEQLAQYDASGATYLFDSVEFHALQTYDGGDYTGDIELIIEFAKQSANMLNYLEDNGVIWKDTTRTYLGALWPRSHEAQNYKSGQGFIDTFVKIIDENNFDVEIIKEVEAKEFIMKDGVVVGVKAIASNGTPYEITANNGVVLATGGFAANKEMRKQYDPSLLDSMPTSNNPAMSGDGIVMAETIGANLVGMNKIQSLPVCNPETGQTSDNVGASTAIFLNAEGVRFVNEAGRRDEITAAVSAQTNGTYFVIVNEKNLMVDENGLNKNGIKVSDLVDKGSTIKADTLEELAEKLGMDPAVVVESVAKFQEAYNNKYDPEFERATFDEYVDLSAGGPYYATERAPAVHHTMGGVQIDTATHVIDTKGNIIKGLYAAGEVTGGIHGDNRLGANAVPDALAFGRVAGINAAQKK